MQKQVQLHPSGSQGSGNQERLFLTLETGPEQHLAREEATLCGGHSHWGHSHVSAGTRRPALRFRMFALVEKGRPKHRSPPERTRG